MGRTLDEAVLGPLERTALDEIVAEARRRYGDDLHGVWLYGSRARGLDEVREGSDLDVLVVTRSPRSSLDLATFGFRLEERMPVAPLSITVVDVGWLDERRSIDAFFVREVDRDRIVVAGAP